MIIHIAPTPFFSDRGCHIRIEGIVSCLEELELQCEICTYHHGNDRNNLTIHRIGTVRGYDKLEAGPSIYKPWANLKLALLVARRIRITNPVALHAHLHEGVLIGHLSRLLALRPRLPIVADLQGSLVGELETYKFFTKAPFIRPIFILLEKIIISSATRIVCSSVHAFNKFKKEFPKINGKLTLVQDGAMAPTDIPTSMLNEIKHDLSISESKSKIIYTGALLNSKGLDNLKELLLRCAPDSKILHFIIIGYPLEDLADFISKNSLEDLCTLTGRVPFSELSTYLQLADIAIDTKKSDAGEGSGKILNYLAHGLAIIAFNSENNRQFLGTEASLCDSADMMYSQTIKYATNDELRLKARVNSVTRFNEYFSWSVTKEQLRRVYLDLNILGS